MFLPLTDDAASKSPWSPWLAVLAALALVAVVAVSFAHQRRRLARLQSFSDQAYRLAGRDKAQVLSGVSTFGFGAPQDYGALVRELAAAQESLDEHEGES